MSSSSSISLRISSALSPSRTTRSGVMPAMPLARAAYLVELRVGLLVRLRAHDVGDAEPLLAVVLRLDHAQHDHVGADARRAAAGEIDRAVAFLGVVDDDQKLRLVTGLVAAALAASSNVPAARATDSRTSVMLPRRCAADKCRPKPMQCCAHARARSRRCP